MASNVADDGDDYKKLCELRELFHGRFTDEEAAVLLEKNNGDVRAAAMVAMIADPATLRQTLNTELASWAGDSGTITHERLRLYVGDRQTVENARRKVRPNRSLLRAAKEGKIDTSSCLFACGPCKHFWWRRTPSRKEVSRCKRCKQKYDPVPVDKMWGWAEFHCTNCQHQFGGWCAMYMTSPCFKCGTRNRPTRIVPPDNSRARKGRSPHSCSAWDCVGNRGAGEQPAPGTPEHEHRCVHPQSRRANGLSEVVHPSPPHDSTGSTVATFLPQGDPEQRQEIIFAPPLPSITEETPDPQNV